MNKVDINNASYNEILSLPLTEKKNQKIWEFVSLSGRINTIYDLVQVELLSIKDIHLLKKHIRITEKNINQNLQIYHIKPTSGCLKKEVLKVLQSYGLIGFIINKM